jgi:transcriptional regulator of aromatic amino acid metabolism
MENLRREIEIVAASDFTVMVLGETGVGKELVVRAIHAASARSDGPMLYLNCAALPVTLAETELFAHIKGAFLDRLYQETYQMILRERFQNGCHSRNRNPFRVPKGFLKAAITEKVNNFSIQYLRATTLLL